jgi:hypothetical protein
MLLRLAVFLRGKVKQKWKENCLKGATKFAFRISYNTHEKVAVIQTILHMDLESMNEANAKGNPKD